MKQEVTFYSLSTQLETKLIEIDDWVTKGKNFLIK